MKEIYKSYKERSVVGKKTKWQGYWLTSERFYHIPNDHKYIYDRDSKFNSTIQNIHTFFRKKFVINHKEITSAKIFITGDDVYKLYINTEFVGEGPAQSYPFAYNYNCFDVTDLLKKGENTIAVHLHYYGLANVYTLSADNLCGFIAQLEIEFSDGTKQIITSDRSWKYIESDYTNGEFVGALITFAENINYNKYPKNWRKGDFNDSSWINSYIQAKPFPIEYNLVPQITPTVMHETKKPVEIKKIENGYWFDFGKEIAGNVFAKLKGKKNDVVIIRCGEELLDNGRVRYELRASTTYQEYITLSGEEDTLEFFEYKGFRYAEILNVSEDFDPSTVCAICRNYPFEENKASFSCSNDLMNKIWDICANAVKVGVQDTYYDCVTRERGGFVGDAYPTSLVHYYMTADIRVFKKFIFDLANASRYSPAIPAHVPSYNLNICTEYSFMVPMFLESYYNLTGDKKLLKEMLPVAEGVLDHYSQFLNKDNLLDSIVHMPKVAEYMPVILIDWPKNLRDDYDYDTTKVGHGICTFANMFFYGFLKRLAYLYNIVGNTDRAEELEKLYTKVGNSIINFTYDSESGLFKDTPISNHSSLHANTLQLLFDLKAPNGNEPIINLIKEKRLNCNGLGCLLIQALFDIGEKDLAYDLLNSKDEHSWYNMVKEGATATFEAWGKDQKWNTSLCHPCFASPAYFYAAEIMGIKPFNAIENSYIIKPFIPEDLDWAELEMPIPSGKIKANFKRKDGKIIYTICTPECVELYFENSDDIVFVKE